MDPSAADTTTSDLGALHSRVAALEAELGRRDAQLAEVEQIAGVGSWEWDIPADHATWSPEMFRIFGHEPDSFAPNLESFLGALHPDDRPQAERALKRAIDGTEPFAVVHRIIWPDGNERLVICRGQVFRSEDGAPKRMVGATVDLSEYRGVADSMRASHEQLLAAEGVAGIGSFEWDVSDDSVTWSEGLYRIFDLRPGEFAGTYQAYLELVHPDDRGTRRAHVDALAAAGDELDARHRIMRPSGEVRWLNSKLKALRDRKGRLVTVIGVCRDVTAEETSAGS
jgi:PAS domain S-box-containing protein